MIISLRKSILSIIILSIALLFIQIIKIILQNNMFWLNSKANNWFNLDGNCIEKEMAKENKGSNYFFQWLEYDENVQVMPHFDQFIISNSMDGRLGNQMFRYASLFALGQMLNRTPIYANEEDVIRKMDSELRIGFPNLHKRIYFLKSNNSLNFDVVEFGKDCCDYVDPKILLSYNYSRILKLDGPGNFQNYKYFHHLKHQIFDLFSFGKEIIEKVETLRKRLFINEDALFFCVHTRNGDFKPLGPSNSNQVGIAIDRIFRYLSRFAWKKSNNTIMLLFGEDKPLLQSLKFGKGYISYIYYIIDYKMSRIEELHFAQTSCDLFLNTAPLSSYAFWMGYLMPANRPIFFIRKLILEHNVDTFQQLPLDWIPIEEDWLKLEKFI